MESLDRKRLTVITKYAVEEFKEADWYTLGQITGKLDVITGHPRLLRSMDFGDPDYGPCVAEVMAQIFDRDSILISEVIDNFDIDLWYQQKSPDKASRLFNNTSVANADFWAESHLRLFVSHLTANRDRLSDLKSHLSDWGISAFLAHEDIEPSREWRDEVEAALETMEVMLAVVAPGFKESEWCAQEVGFALGRKIDIITLCLGLSPFGFFGKYQGLQIKGKYPDEVACEVAQLILKRPKHRDSLLQSIAFSLARQKSQKKLKLIRQIEKWPMVTDEQIKSLLEKASLTKHEKEDLRSLIDRVGAFVAPKKTLSESLLEEDDIPF